MAFEAVGPGAGRGRLGADGRLRIANGIPTQAGQGLLDEMLTAGATWYPDEAKKWSISVAQPLRVQPGAGRHGHHPGPGLHGRRRDRLRRVQDDRCRGDRLLPAAGDRGHAARRIRTTRDRVAGIGPEISAFFPKIMLGVSLRYAYEFMAENRLQGNTVTLTAHQEVLTEAAAVGACPLWPRAWVLRGGG